MSDVSQGPGWWVASDGKWYPPQATPGTVTPPLSQPVPGQAPAPKKRGRGCLYGVLGVLALIVIIIVIAALTGNGDKSPNGASPTTLESTSAPGNTTAPGSPGARYKIGDTAKTGDFEVTVYGAKDPQPSTSQFSTPSSGSHFVSADVQITNPGTAQRSFSSLLGFHLLDSVNRQYDENITSGVTPGAPEGEIAGGQSIRGFVVFEVPDGTTGLKLRVQGGLTAAGAVFSLQ
jgi:hypothetical protein